MATQNSATMNTSFGLSGAGTSPGAATGQGTLATDQISEFTAGSGIKFNQLVTFSSAGVGGIAGQAVPTVFHSGGFMPYVATAGTDTTPATTVIYAVEVYIENNATITGISLLNGSGSAGNITVALADSTGLPIAAAQSATTAQGSAAVYQQIPFATPYAAKGPARYYIMVMFDNTGAHFRALPVGNFRSGSVTGQTYGTFTSVAAIVAFTTNLGPIADTY
jgi:hypothetical protein